jgi:hypothetical protein
LTVISGCPEDTTMRCLLGLFKFWKNTSLFTSDANSTYFFVLLALLLVTVNEDGVAALTLTPVGAPGRGVAAVAAETVGSNSADVIRAAAQSRRGRDTGVDLSKSIMNCVESTTAEIDQKPSSSGLAGMSQ